MMSMGIEGLEVSKVARGPRVPSSPPEAAPKQLAAGAVLRGRYVIDSCLGRGGVGTVYKAIDEFRRDHGEFDYHVAIKVLHEGADERPAALSRLRREFFCAQVLSHPNVVKVFELDRDGELDFFTMEWLDGELLSNVLQQFAGQPLPRTAAWAIIRQIGEGIAHAHERGAVHADLRPENILLTESGQIRILDFGGAIGGGAEHTPAYASCELLAGKPADKRDDLYALACLSCELLSGQHPFWHQRSTEARMALAVPTRPPNLSARQWRALQQGLAWDRVHRSISVCDWLGILNPQAITLHAIPRPQSDAAPSAPTKLSAARIMGALGVFLACLSGWALFNRPARLGMTASAMVSTQAASTAPAAPVAPSQDVAEEQRAIPPTASASTMPPPAAARPMGQAINLAPASYHVPPGTNFAEILVRRSSASADRSSFEWWTEESSAVSGVDYVAQPRSKVTFLPGSRTTSLFVRLLADSSRKQAAKFDVVIGGASRGISLGVSRAEIILPPGGSALDAAVHDVPKPDAPKPDALKRTAMTSMTAR
jgi:serine/threonine protein kinase